MAEIRAEAVANVKAKIKPGTRTPARTVITWTSPNWVSFAVASDSLPGVYYDVGICRSGEATCDCQGCELGGHVCKHIRRCITVMSAIVNAESKAQAIAMYEEQRSLIKGQVMPEGASDAEFQLFIEVAAQYGLNPLNGEIWAIRGKGSKTGPGPIKPRVGYEGYYRKAQEHPDFEWMAVECWYENDKIEINLGTGEVSHIAAMGDQGKLVGCWVQVQKRSRPQPFVRRYFLEQMKPPKRTTKDGYAITTPWDSNPVQMLVGAGTRLTLKALFSLYLPPDSDFETEFSDSDEPKAQLPKSSAKAIAAKSEESAPALPEKSEAVESAPPAEESPATPISAAEEAVRSLEAYVAEEKSRKAKSDATIPPADTSDTVEPVTPTAPRGATPELAEGPQEESASSTPDVSSTSAAPKPKLPLNPQIVNSEPTEPVGAPAEAPAKPAPTIGLGFDKDDLMINREKAEIDTDAALAVLGFPDIGHPSAYATIIPKVCGVQEPAVPQDLPDEAFAKFGKWVRKVARKEWTVPDVISEYILAQAEKAEVAVEVECQEDSDPLAEEAPKRGRGRPPKAKDEPSPQREDGQGEEKLTSSSSEGASTNPQSESGSSTVSEIVVAASDDEYDPFEDPEMAELVQEYKDANAKELQAIKYLQDRGISSTYMVSVRKGPHWIECTLRHRDEKRPETDNALVAWIIVEGMQLKKAEVAG